MTKDVESKQAENLHFFQNAKEDEFPQKLKLIEELNGIEGFSVDGYTMSPLCGFHPKAVRMVVKDDDYYLGCRADNFVLIYGYSEAIEIMLDESASIWGDCVVCLANHKGGLIIQVFSFVDD